LKFLLFYDIIYIEKRKKRGIKMKRVYVLIWWDKEDNRIKQYTCASRTDLMNTIVANFDMDIENDELCDYTIKVIEVPDDEEDY
jgi:hypothetical protein